MSVLMTLLTQESLLACVSLAGMALPVGLLYLGLRRRKVESS